MSILIIGTGAIGKRHHNNLQELGENVISVSMRAEGIEAVKKHLKSGVEAAVICTETQLRLPIVELAAKYQTPVYIEKPIAFDLAEMQKIFKVMGPLAKKSFVGFMMRYHPAVQYLAGLNQSDIYRFSFEIGHDVNQWRDNWRFEDSYAAKTEGGGVLLDLCHELDMAHVILGNLELLRVDSVAHPKYPNVDFSTQISLLNSQSTGVVSMDYVSPVSKRTVQLMGQKENITFDFAADNFQILRPEGVESLDLSIDRQEMFKSAMADFLKLVRGGPCDNSFAPILANELEVCSLICDAYHKRSFKSVLKV